MFLYVAAILVGLFLLLWSSDRFIHGAAAAATHFGVSRMLIGVLVVGFGTSTPEMVVSAVAAWGGNPMLAIGNALDSNITNIGLVLGVATIIAPVIVGYSTFQKEVCLVAGCKPFGGGVTKI